MSKQDVCEWKAIPRGEPSGSFFNAYYILTVKSLYSIFPADASGALRRSSRLSQYAES
ncbi:MAG: hypothetical protein FWD13_03045 [Treponema sp.]|nr:hypothetical protein [Treponema sp.]